jgi:hypothetical protein
MYVYTTYTWPLSVQAQYSRSCRIINSSCYNSSLVTWMVWLNSKPRIAYNPLARTTQETPFLCCCAIVAFVSVAAVTCLPSRCLETALVYLSISRSLHGNGCTRYTMNAYFAWRLTGRGGSTIGPTLCAVITSDVTGVFNVCNYTRCPVIYTGSC